MASDWLGPPGCETDHSLINGENIMICHELVYWRPFKPVLKEQEQQMINESGRAVVIAAMFMELDMILIEMMGRGYEW